MIRFSSGMRWHVPPSLQVYDAATSPYLPHGFATSKTAAKNSQHRKPPTFKSEGHVGEQSAGNQSEKCSQIEIMSGKLSAIDKSSLSNKGILIVNSSKWNCRYLSTCRFAITGLACGSSTVASRSMGMLCHHRGHKTLGSNSEVYESCSHNNSNSTDLNDESLSEIVAETIPSFFEHKTSKLPSIDGESALANNSHGDETSSHGNKDELVPPDPESCCGSGCVNCVYIKYVQDVLDRDPNDRQKVKEVLDEIEDFNVRMFIKLELGL
ncbi:uncharacterized protein [Amphiura filiformis]|uniref:uncharacterized protein n=1 Tax=Amphiura filiformis TaxID=82378 RepID=UPI003B213641